MGEQADDSETVTFLNLFEARGIAVASVGCVWALCCLHLLFYGMEFLLDRFGSNIYLSQIFMACSEMCGYLLTPLITAYVSTLRYCIFSIGTVSILALALAFIRVPEDCEWCFLHVLQMGCLIFLRMFLCSFWSSFYLYIVEVYPAGLRSMAIGIACFFGFFVSILAPLMQNMHRPMLLLGVCGVTLFGYLFLMPNRKLACSHASLQEEKENRSEAA